MHDIIAIKNKKETDLTTQQCNVFQWSGPPNNMKINQIKLPHITKTLNLMCWTSISSESVPSATPKHIRNTSPAESEILLIPWRKYFQYSMYAELNQRQSRPQVCPCLDNKQKFQAFEIIEIVGSSPLYQQECKMFLHRPGLISWCQQIIHWCYNGMEGPQTNMIQGLQHSVMQLLYTCTNN